MFSINKKNRKLLDFFSLDIFISIIFLLVFLMDLIFFKMEHYLFSYIFLFFIFLIYLKLMLSVFPLKFKHIQGKNILEIKKLIIEANFRKIFLLFFRFIFMYYCFYKLINLYKTYNYKDFFCFLFLYIFIYCLLFIEIKFFDKILIMKISYLILSKDFLVVDFYEDYNGFYELILMDDEINQSKIKLSIFNYSLKIDYTKFNFY